MVLVKKKDGTLHMCIDYQDLNRNTLKKIYPIPCIVEFMDELRVAKYFSKIDMCSAYQDVAKTSFLFHYGHFEFLVMPFRLTNAPATFHSCMNHVFYGQLRCFVLVFFDDILIYNRTWEEHLQHLEVVLPILEEKHLYAKMSKCEFGIIKMLYLGACDWGIWSEGTSREDSGYTGLAHT